MSDAFIYPEKAVMERSGLSAARLRTVRETLLEKERDWTLAGRLVLYSQKGMQNLAEKLGLPKPAQTPLIPNNPQAGDRLTVVVLMGGRNGITNQRIIIAIPKGADEHDLSARVRVRVGDNKRYIRGMELTAIYHARGLWLSEKEPRAPGRW